MTITLTIRKDQILSILLPICICCLSIGIYLHPLTLAPTPSESPRNKQKWKLIYSPNPQLDELHIMHADHHDISPQETTSWTDAWHNDYWGRPLSGESSHKSWRPVSIWSFRFMKGGDAGRRFIAYAGRAAGSFVEGMLGSVNAGFRSGSEHSYKYGGEALASELFVHRFVNVLIHAAIVQIVGAVATLLFSSDRQRTLTLYTKYISQILFALHPVHVEAVVNVANRPHILALLFNATILDPNAPLAPVAILSAMGLLTAETAIFQFPAIVLTMTAIRYRELLVAEKQRSRREGKAPPKSPLVTAIVTLLPRYILLGIISVSYLVYRHINDTLSIPDGLIRPAENPFYDKLDKNQWTLATRMMNYSYVLSLHIMKAFGVETIGMSHEYGFDCIPEMDSMLDDRMKLPMLILLSSVGLTVLAWYGWTAPREGSSSKWSWRKREERVERILHVLVFFSWLVRKDCSRMIQLCSSWGLFSHTFGVSTRLHCFQYRVFSK